MSHSQYSSALSTVSPGEAILAVYPGKKWTGFWCWLHSNYCMTPCLSLFVVCKVALCWVYSIRLCFCEAGECFSCPCKQCKVINWPCGISCVLVFSFRKIKRGCTVLSIDIMSFLYFGFNCYLIQIKKCKIRGKPDKLNMYYVRCCIFATCPFTGVAYVSSLSMLFCWQHIYLV